MYVLERRELEGALHRNNIQKRDYYECDEFGNCTVTPWGSWGRWVALVLILLGFFFLFMMCIVIGARRRHVRGQYPIWGTGWALGPKPNHWQYDPDSSTHQPVDPNPAPPYSPPVYGNYYSQPPGPPPQQYELQSPYVGAGNNYGQLSQPQGQPPEHQAGGQYFPPPSNPPQAHMQGGNGKG